MNRKAKLILSLYGALIIAIVLYIFLHEAGHTLVALACGAEITVFSILTAHMSYTGGSFNQATSSLLHAGGVLLPLVTVFVLLCFYRKNKGGALYHCGYFALTMISIFSALAWVFLPLVSLFTVPPAGDDVTMFMAASGLSPVIVMLGASLAVLFMAWFSIKRGLFSSFRKLIEELRQK